MPITVADHEREIEEPALCEQLPVRDYLDKVMVRTSGAFVAGYRLGGLAAYFVADEERDRAKYLLGALLRSLPEQSMRLQLRAELVEDLGDLVPAYAGRHQSSNEVAQALDAERIGAWERREAEGGYTRLLVSAYLVWDPRLAMSPAASRYGNGGWALSARAAARRSRREHRRLLGEFENLLVGIEGAMLAAGLGPRRLDEQELFLETRRALAPLDFYPRPYAPADDSLEYRSAREQLVAAAILEETESYLNVGGLLYSVVSLKDLPDATFPGILRELAALDFPFVASAQVLVPEQAKVLKNYKSRLRKMQAAQRDTRGGVRTNVEAQVAEAQLVKVQQEIISSSVKTAKLSLIFVVRTSRPALTRAQLEQAEALIAGRRQQLLSAISRMNGSRGVVETLAKRRLWIGTLPGMGEADRREHDVLTSNAADLLPLETPWQGTSASPLFLFETPYRQLIPFSPFDPGLGDANLLIMAKSGGGKTFLVQQMLSMASRANPLISILERGDSYRALVELMGGRMITMSLDGRHTLNPWDLPRGEHHPPKDQVAFLKNLTRHMLGEAPASDPELLDNLINEAILRTYKRVSIRSSSPVPTFGDLRDELAHWRDEDKSHRMMEEAALAAAKLRSWTGERGVYARLFDRPTTVPLDSPWLFFNVEQLADDPRLETAMSLLIAHATAQRAAGAGGRPSITVLDECWFLLDSPLLAPEVVQLFRTARKRNASVWGISQTAEDFVGTESSPRPHGAGIVKNASTKIIGQQPGDSSALRDHLHLNQTALNYIRGFAAPRKGRSADALIVIGEKAETTHAIRLVPTPLDYWISTTYARERNYRDWWLAQHAGMPLLDAYRGLAARFPFGLAEIAPLPEEASSQTGNGAIAK